MVSLLPGGSLGRYQVVEEIGRGGMAAVFRAFDPELGRDVAIKVLPSYHSEDPTFLDRFRSEARTVARLNHPNIIKVYDFGGDKGFTYLVMELLPGGTLKDRLVGRLALPEALEYLVPLASALDYAHGQAVMHRDVKPSNVLMDGAGKPILSDFGLSRLLGASAGVTAQGLVVGTPEYMAPEQALGRAVDHRADLYALGVMAYQMLLGRTPFHTETAAETLLSQIHQPPPPPRTLDPNIEPRLEAILLKALAKNPDDRYRSAGDLVGALSSSAISSSAGAQAGPEVAAEELTRQLLASPGQPEGLAAQGATAQAGLQQSATRVAEPSARWRVPVLPAVAVGMALMAAAAVGIWLAVGRAGPEEGQVAPVASQPAATQVALPTVAGAPAPAATQVALPTVAGVPLPTDLDALSSRALQRAATVRKLQPTGAVTALVVSREELTRKQLEALERTRPQFETQQSLLSALGLIPEGLDLFKLTVDLFTQQGLGFYDFQRQELYIVRDPAIPGTILEFHLAKQYVHALQQQHFDVARMENEARGSLEASLILRTLIEADARMVQAEYAVAHFTPQQYRDLLSAGSDNPIFEKAPYAIRRLFDFAFTDGIALMKTLLMSGDRKGVDEALRHPPVSTEQIIHSDKYLAREAPVPVSLPNLVTALGPGWVQIAEDVMGEFLLRTFLETRVEKQAAGAAAGWAGDRFALLEGPLGGKFLVLLTAWDTPADAQEFYGVARSEAAIPQKGYVGIQGNRVLVILGPSEALVAKIKAQFLGY